MGVNRAALCCPCTDTLFPHPLAYHFATVVWALRGAARLRSNWGSCLIAALPLIANELGDDAASPCVTKTILHIFFELLHRSDVFDI